MVATNIRPPANTSKAANIRVGSENALSNANGKIFMGTMIAPLAIGGVGSLLSTIGGWFKSDGLINAGTKVKGFKTAINETPIQELAGDTSFGKAISNGSQTIADTVGGWLGGLDKNGKIFNWLKKSQQGDVKSHRNVLEKLVGELEASMINKKTGAKLLGDGHDAIVSQISSLKGLIKSVETPETHKALNEAISALQENVKGIDGAKGFLSKLTEVNDRSTMLGKLFDSNLGNNLKETISNIPNNIGKMSTHELVFQGANALMYAGEAYGMIKDFRSNMQVMKAMYKDMTGKDASTFKIMFGDVPAPVKMMRKQYMSRNLFANFLNFGGFVAGQVAFNKGHKEGWGMLKTMGIGMGASMGTSMLSSYLIKPTDAGQTYATLANAQSQGVQVPAESYAQLFASIAPAIGKTGMVAGRNVMELANACASSQVDLGSALKMFDEALKGKSFAGYTSAISMQEAQRTSMLQQQPNQAVGQFTSQYMNRGAGAMAPHL